MCVYVVSITASPPRGEGRGGQGTQRSLGCPVSALPPALWSWRGPSLIPGASCFEALRTRGTVA